MFNFLLNATLFHIEGKKGRCFACERFDRVGDAECTYTLWQDWYRVTLSILL